jgi:LytS/YehU family sensor histidine kinase
VSAEKSLKYGLEVADKYNFPKEKVKIYKELSLIAAQRGRYKSAFLYQADYQALKDSIANIETKKHILNLEAKYNSAEKERKINSLKNENLIKEVKIETQQRRVIAIVSGSLFIIVVLILLYFQKQLKNKNRLMSMEQQLLRSQMNPHFLFNSLIAIQGYVLKNKKLEASNYLSQYAGLMRAILESSRENFISLKEEIEIVERYVSLQQLRFENSFHFILNVDDTLDTSAYKIPPMILQPFIENGIEHGLRQIEEGEKFLKVSYQIIGEKLQISVEDNGAGIGEKNGDKNQNHKSYAMQITKERLINITKLFKIKVDLSVVNLSSVEEKRGTRVELTFPLKKIKIMK